MNQTDSIDKSLARPRTPPADARRATPNWRALLPWVSTACRLVLGGVFLYAGLAKMSNPDAMTRAVRAYKILPEGLVHLFSYGLPFVEVVAAVLLLAGIATRVAAVVTGGLLLMFIVAIISVWARGIQIDCGCFGGGGAAHVSGLTYFTEILRDTGLLALAAWLIWQPASRFALTDSV
jgi:uncharacterized membrane protein YphA (DoxX/SURF4 family)